MIFVLPFFVLNAMKREIGPTLPRYIVMMMTILPHIFNADVRFLLNPTVAVALTVSYTMSSTSASVTADKRRVEINMVIKDMPATATALLTACFEIVLSKRTASSLLFIVASVETINIAAVTVLTPPAVPDGDPPMNMSSNETTEDALVRSCCGIAAKPAVLVVMD